MRDQINVRLNAEQKTRLQARAKALGLTASEVARIAIGEYLERRETDDRRPSAGKDDAEPSGE